MAGAAVLRLAGAAVLRLAAVVRLRPGLVLVALGRRGQPASEALRVSLRLLRLVVLGLVY